MKASHRFLRKISTLFLSVLIVSPSIWSHESEKSLAIINGGVQRSEDAPFVGKDFQFLPGDYVYLTFQITGFASKLNEKSETKAISLEYEVTPHDAKHRPVAESIKGVIKDDLGKEDKNWTPKRRSNFLLPSYIAAGTYAVHIVVKDLIAKTEDQQDYPFQLGGVKVDEATAIQVTDFSFQRTQEDVTPLDLPAYAPGDTVWGRFEMLGFKYDDGNTYKLSYGIKILRPDGKVFLDAPQAAQISAGSFYPAPYVPGDLQITTPKNAAKGKYLLTLTVRDLVANQSVDLQRTFTIE
jgi:hypothetical protein